MSKIWMLCDFTKEAYIQYACQKELHNTWTKSIEIEKKPVNDYCIKILCQEFFYISSDSNSNRRLLITLYTYFRTFLECRKLVWNYFGFGACHRESYQTALAEKRLFSSVFLYVTHFRFNLSMAITLVHSAHWLCDIACAVKKV